MSGTPPCNGVNVVTPGNAVMVTRPPLTVFSKSRVALWKPAAVRALPMEILGAEGKVLSKRCSSTMLPPSSTIATAAPGALWLLA